MRKQNGFEISVGLVISLIYLLMLPGLVKGSVSSGLPGELETIRDKIQRMVEEGKVPSIAVSVSMEGKIIWEEAFGWANREEKIRATPHSIYSLASMGKSITATALMILVERGRVDLDAPVNDYIAPARLSTHDGTPSAATVRQLLNCTAAIPHGWCSYHGEKIEPLPLATFINRYGISVLPPGEKFMYSNFSYLVLEYVIARVSGKSFREFLRSEIFTPLGLQHIMVAPDYEKSSNRVTGYTVAQKPIAYSSYYTQPLSSLGIYGSAHDVMRYGMFHLKYRSRPGGESILKDQTLDMIHFSKDKQSSNHPFALGWGSLDLGEGCTLLISNGGTGSTCSALLLIPSKKIAVVCLTNINSPNRITDQLAVEILNALVPSISERFEKAKQAVMKDIFRSYNPTQELLGKWEGEIRSYEGSIPVTVKFQPDGDIHIRLNKQYETLLHNPRIDEGYLTGDFYGVVFEEETQKGLQDLSLGVRLKDGVLSGYVSAIYKNDKGLFQLPASIRLVKKQKE